MVFRMVIMELSVLGGMGTIQVNMVVVVEVATMAVEVALMLIILSVLVLVDLPSSLVIQVVMQ